MADKVDASKELKELTDEEFEDTDFWSKMLDDNEDPSFVERPVRTEGFLDDKEIPIQTEDTTQQSNTPLTEDSSTEKKSKKRYLFFILPFLLLFLIGGSFSIYHMFFSSDTESIPKEQEAESAPVATEEQEGTAIETKEVERFSTAWAPFWLRLQRDGKEVFVTLSFTTVTTNPKVIQEIQHKEVILRDAIYYYLQNITLSSNHETIEKIKKDIVEILNSYISSGTVDSLGVETFFIQ